MDVLIYFRRAVIAALTIIALACIAFISAVISQYHLEQSIADAVYEQGGHSEMGNIAPTLPTLGFVNGIHIYDRVATVSLGPRTDDAVLRKLHLLTHLRELRIFGNGVPRDVRTVFQCKAVEKLVLVDVPIGQEDMNRVPSLVNLRMLVIRRSGITDESLQVTSELPRLQLLDVAQNPVTDRGVAWLSECKDMRYLDLSHTRVTDAGIHKLASCSKLQAVNVAGTAVTDSCAPLARHYEKLIDVRVGDTLIDVMMVKLCSSTFSQLANDSQSQGGPLP